MNHLSLNLRKLKVWGWHAQSKVSAELIEVWQIHQPLEENLSYDGEASVNFE